MPVISMSSGLIQSLPFDVERLFDESSNLSLAAVNQIETELSESQDWTSLRRLYEFAVQLGHDAEAGRQLMVKAGLVCLEQLGDGVTAEAYFRRVLATDPGNYAALDSYAELCAAQGRYAEAADYFDAAIAQAPDFEKVDICLRLAEVCERELEKGQRAIDALEFAYSIDPSRVDTLRMARKSLTRQGRFIEAHAALDAEYLAVESADGISDDMRASFALLFRELGLELSRTSLDMESARACLEKARELGDIRALSYLDDLRYRELSYQAYAEELIKKATSSVRPLEAAAYFVEAAELYYAVGHDLLRSEACIERALSVVPGFPGVLKYLERAYGNQPETAELYRERLQRLLEEATNVDFEIQLLQRLATLSHTQPEEGEDELASQIEAYEKLIELAPSHSESVDALLEIWEDRGEPEKAIEVLTQYLQAVNSNEVRVSAHIRLGQIYLEGLGKVEEATRQFQAALALEPRNFSAASALRAIYLDSNEDKPLLDCLDILLVFAPDLPSRVSLVNEMLDVAQRVSESAVFNAKRKMFLYQPETEGLRDELDELAASNQSRYLWIDTLIQTAQANSGEVGAGLWVHVGDWLVNAFHRSSDAIEAYRQALGRVDNYEAALEALDRLNDEKSNPEGAAAQLEAALQTSSAPSEQARILDHLTAINLDQLESPETALGYAQQLKELDFESARATALIKLQRVYEKTEDWEALAETLEQREKYLTHLAKAEIQFERGKLLLQKLNKRELAAEVLIEAYPVLTEVVEIVDLLFTIAKAGVQADRIAKLIEPRLGQLADFARQAAILEIQLESELDAEVRARVGLRIGRIRAERLKDLEGALAVWSSSICGTTFDSHLLSAISRTANTKELARQASDALRVAAERTEGTLRSLIQSTRGTVLAQAFGPNDEVKSLFWEVLSDDLRNKAALNGFLGCSVAEESVSESLAQLTSQDSWSSEGAQVKEAFASVMMLAAEQGVTGDWLDSLVETVTNSTIDSARVMLALYTLGQRSTDIVTEQKWTRVDDSGVSEPVKSSIRMKKAVSCLAAENSSEALSEIREGLSIWPVNSEAKSLLESLVSKKEFFVEAAELLTNLSQRLEDKSARVQVLRARALHAETDAEKKKFYSELARMQGVEIASPIAAHDTMAEAQEKGLLVADDYYDLCVTALRAERLDKVEEIAEKSNDLNLKKELARFFEGVAWDLDKARVHWHRISELDPADVEARSAVERLRPYDEAVVSIGQMLEERGESCEELEEATLYYLRAASVFSGENQLAKKARETLEKAFELAPEDLYVLQTGGRILAEIGTIKEAEQLLLSAIETTQEPSRIACLYVSLGRIFHASGDLQQAAERYGKALSFDPGHYSAVGAVEELMGSGDSSQITAIVEARVRAKGDWKALVDIYQSVVDETQDDKRKVEHLNAIRKIKETTMNDASGAFDAAAQAFRTLPENDHIANTVSRLASETGRSDEWMHLLVERAEKLPENDPQRLALRKRVAQFYENELGNKEESLRCWQELLSEWPENYDALDAITRLGGELGDELAVSSAFERLASLQEDRDTRIEYLRAAASLIENREEKHSDAASLYRKILDEEPDDIHALEKLDDLLVNLELHDELKLVIHRRLEFAHTVSEQGVLKSRYGRLCVEKLGLHTEGLDHLKSVVDWRHLEGLEAAANASSRSLFGLMNAVEEDNLELSVQCANIVEPYWTELEDFEKVIRCKAVHANAEEGDTKAALLQECALIYEDKLNEPVKAFELLAKYLHERLHDYAWFDELQRISSLINRDSELARALKEALLSDDTHQTFEEQWLRLARVYEERLDDLTDAAFCYEKVREIREFDELVLESLIRVYTATGALRELVSVYRSVLAIPEQTEERKIEVWAQITEILEVELDDAPLALDAYDARIVLEPENVSIVEAMVALAEKALDGPHLTDGLSRLLSLSDTDDDVKIELLERHGVAAYELCEDNNMAVGSFAEVLSLSPEHEKAVVYLERIFEDGGEPRLVSARILAEFYKRNGRMKEYLSALEALLESEIPKEERVEILVEIAEVSKNTLSEPGTAFEYAGKAFELEPSTEAAISLLEQVTLDCDWFERLAGFYSAQISGIQNFEIGQKIRHRLAEIYEHELSDNDQAIEVLMSIIELSPSDCVALQSLERLYKELGSFSDLAEVYKHRVQQADTDNARVGLMRELARIEADLLLEPETAIGTLNELLLIDEHDIPALRRLAKLYEQNESFAQAEATLRKILSAPEDELREELIARKELARLFLDFMSREQDGYELLAENIAVAPTDEGTRQFVRERLEIAISDEREERALRFAQLNSEALRAGPEPRELVEALRTEITLSEELATKAGINREIANIYLHQLDQKELAFAALSQAVTNQPDDKNTLSHLEELGEELMLLDEVLDVYEHIASESDVSEVAFDLKTRTALILQHKLLDLPAAIASWQSVLQLRPFDLMAAESLDVIYSDQQDWQKLSEILPLLAEIVSEDTERTTQISMRLGRINEEELANPLEAIQWYEKAWRLDAVGTTAAEALERLLTEEEQPELLAEVLVSVVWNNEGDVDDQLRRLLCLSRIKSLKPEGRSDAITFLEAALEIDINNKSAVSQLENLYEQEERWKDLGQLITRQMETSEDLGEKLELQKRRAFIVGTQLGTPEEAIEVWNDVLTNDPNDQMALKGLRKSYRQAELWPSLVETIKKSISIEADSKGIKDLRFELAEVYLNHLDSRADAINESKRVLDIQPLTVGEMVRLEGIFTSAEAYSDAVRVMQYRIDVTDDKGEKVDVLFNVADIYRHKLRRAASAVEIFERILDEEPENDRAYGELESLYEESSDYSKLIDLLDRRKVFVTDEEEKENIVMRRVELQTTKLGAKEMAFVTAIGAFAESPNSSRIQELAEKLAEETGSWEDLADVYVDALDEPSIPLPRKMELRRSLAGIYASKLEDFDEAEDNLEVVVQTQPDETEAWIELAGIMRQQARWDDLIETRRRQVKMNSDDEAAKEALLEIANVLSEEFDNISESISVLREGLLIDASDIRLIEALSQRLEKTSQWMPLVEVLESKLNSVEGDSAKGSVQYEIAQIWDECIDDPDRAVTEYRAALDKNPGEMRALKALEHLYAEMARFEELCDVYKQQATFASEAGVAVEMWGRVATILKDKLGDLSGAANALVKGLESDPAHLPTVRELEVVWNETQDWSQLSEAYQRHLALIQEDSEEYGSVQLKLGAVYEKLGNLEQSEIALTAVLDRQPSSIEAIHGLAQLYENKGDYERALSFLGQEAEQATNSHQVATALFKMGNIFESMLGEREQATEFYNRAIEANASEVRSIRALCDIRKEEENWEDVARLEELEAANLEESAKRADAYCAAAKTRLEYFDDIEAGIRLSLLAVDSYPEHEAANRYLAQLYYMNQVWESAERYLEKVVQLTEHAASDAEKGELYFRLAYISEKLSEEDLALERYLQSNALSPNNLDVLEGLANALKRASRLEEAEGIYRDILVHHRDTYTNAEVVFLYSQLGEIASAMEKFTEAASHFDSALELEGSDPTSLRGYAQLCEKTQDWERAFQLRARLITNLYEDEKFDELLRQANMCEVQLQDKYRAVEALAMARKLRPDNEAVVERLFAMLKAVGQVEQAIAVGRDLLALRTSDADKFEQYCELAQLFDVGQKEWKKSALAYNKALELQPENFEVFVKQVDMLTKYKRKSELAYAYQLMIQRLGNKSSTASKRAVLWKSLGDHYRDVTKDKAAAAQAYECVLRITPDNHDVALELAAVQQTKRNTVGQALEIYHDLAVKSADPEKPIRELFELYGSRELEEFDKCLVSAATLVFLDKASNIETKAYEQLMSRAPDTPSRPITEHLWKNLVFHPACRNPVSDILRELAVGFPTLFGGAQQKLELKKKERVDLGSKNSRRLRYLQIWDSVATSMSAPRVEHYFREFDGSPPRIFPGSSNILFVGKQSMVFKEMPKDEIVWILSRELTFARPEFSAVRALSAYDVALMLEATVKLFTGGKASGMKQNLEKPKVEQMQELLKGYFQKDKHMQEVLQPLVTECMDKRSLGNFREFLYGVEHTASRVAVLLSSDIRSVIQGLNYTEPVTDMSERRRMREIRWFLMSNEHFALREQLGLQLTHVSKPNR
ncbi:MAG: tetratricopeptide repeat protein [Myxococcota bacterium]|nr:tetratricopeptide repeat protein [Myxococcota bacterium]